MWKMYSDMGDVKLSQIAMIHYLAPPIIGGVESTIYHHTRLLADLGFRVKIIAGRGETFHHDVSFHSIPEVDSRHPDVLEVGKSLAEGQVTPHFNRLRDSLIEYLRPLISEVDVCIIHNATTLHKNMALTAALYLLSKEEITPFVSWAHDFAWLDPLYTPDLHPGYPWDLLRIPWTGVRYVAVSAHRKKMLSELLGIPESEIRVIHPGVDMPQFLKLEPLTQRLIEKLDLLDSDPLMLFPTRITRRKNIEFAVKVTGALIEKKPKAHLVVTGPTGPHNPGTALYLGELKSLRTELGIADRVHFLYEHGENGQPLNIPDKVTSDFFKLADLLIFPSFREGFGIPVLEAGLIRLPLFAADIPPVRESSQDLVSLFDPGGDPGSVAENIFEYLAGSSSHHLKKRVLGNFTWQAILIKKVIPLLQEVTAYGQAHK